MKYFLYISIGIILFYLFKNYIIPKSKEKISDIISKAKRKQKLDFNEFEDWEKIEQNEIENEQLKNEWQKIERAYTEKYNILDSHKIKENMRSIKFIDTFEADDEDNVKEATSVATILREDNTFDANLFKKWCINIFEFIQLGTEEELKQIKDVIIQPMYDRKIKQIHRFKKDNIELRREDMLIEDIKILDYGRHHGKSQLKVYVRAQLKEYIIHKDTKKVLKGNSKKVNEKNYIMTFTKKDGEKQVGFIRNCPGCGASVEELEFGRCTYCGNLVNPIRYNWTLIKLEII